MLGVEAQPVIAVGLLERRTRRWEIMRAPPTPSIEIARPPAAPIPASPQSNDDDVDVEPALVGALGPVADELIATRAGGGAIGARDVATATCTGGATGRLTSPPPMGIAIATDGKPAVAATAKPVSQRLS
jgi:hypothetical protein